MRDLTSTVNRLQFGQFHEFWVRTKYSTEEIPDASKLFDKINADRTRMYQNRLVIYTDGACEGITGKMMVSQESEFILGKDVITTVRNEYQT